MECPRSPCPTDRPPFECWWGRQLPPALTQPGEGRPPAPGSAASSRDPVQWVLVAARRPAFDEDAMPDRDLHQSPDGPAHIATRLLFAHQRGHAVGSEPALDGRVPWQHRGELIEKIAAKPLPDRHEEAALPPPHVLTREPTFGPSPQDQLAVSAADLERVRQSQAELDHSLVEEGHPSFHAKSHQHAIDLHEKIVDQIRGEIDIL